MSEGPNKQPFTIEEGRRVVRSFVLRQGRATEAQKRAFELHWPTFGLDYRNQPRDFEQVFGRSAPLVVEIGFGNGEQLLFAAQNEPARNHVGIEVHGPGVGRALNGAAQGRASAASGPALPAVAGCAGAAAAAAQFTNLRIYQHDAVEVLRNEIAPASLDEVRIFFPDPWHKKRHHKRRLVQPAFVGLLCERLRPGGLLHLATDWQGYAEHMWAVLDAEPRLRNRAGPGGSSERPPWRRQTHFETRGLKLGHGVWDLLYDRLPLPVDASPGG